MNPTKFVLLIFFTFLFSSCLKTDITKIKKIEFEEDLGSDWVIPLIKSKLYLKDLIPDSLAYLTVDSNGLYTLHYAGNIFSAMAKDYINLPDQTYNTGNLTLTTPFSIGSFTGTYSDSFKNSFTYADPNGAQLNHINLKSGTLNIQLNTTLQHNLSGTIVFPTITNSGSALSLPFTITNPANSTTITADLTGRNIDLTNSGTTYNYIPYEIRYTITGTGLGINASEGISAQVNLQNLEFSFVDGYLGTIGIPINKDTIGISIFNNAEASNVVLENPTVSLTIKNSFGVNANGNFPNLAMISKTGSINNFSGSFFTNPVTILGASTVGDSMINTFTINKSNSNIQTLFNPLPVKFTYEANVVINPSGTPSYNFVTENSKIDLDAKVDLPLWFSTSAFAVQDTISVGTLPKDTNIVESLEFKMRIINAMGISAKTQVYFTDTFYNVIDSLFKDNNDFLAEAGVDGNGNVITPTTTEKIATITRLQYINIAPNTKFAIAKATLKTSGTGTVKIKSNDYISIQLAARAKIKIKL